MPRINWRRRFVFMAMFTALIGLPWYFFPLCTYSLVLLVSLVNIKRCLRTIVNRKPYTVSSVLDTGWIPIAISSIQALFILTCLLSPTLRRPLTSFAGFHIYMTGHWVATECWRITVYDISRLVYVKRFHRRERVGREEVERRLQKRLSRIR
ncbi:hypothetical protein P154DRAFT_577069 [Amniculicola lignicola CBS 123094]|uniref:Uncharacterized protein n=1 Tax=Amniculicola lignicola CBS 123094 TaxID=1392246 RepID=A0A6A5WE34_9PLEO|nr:hypothetical protein P154DRAFT_577069 [Amniculicola lignicola CBS 123094]